MKQLIVAAVVAMVLAGCQKTPTNSCADALEAIKAEVMSDTENLASSSGFRLRTLTDVTDPLVMQDLDYGQVCQATLHWSYRSDQITAPVDYQTNTSGGDVRIVSSRWF